MRGARFTLLSTLVLIVGLQPASAQVMPGLRGADWDEERRKYTAEALQGFQELVTDWQQAAGGDDASRVGRFYTDDAVLHLRDEFPIMGRTAIEEVLRELLPTISHVEMGVSDFAASGRLAYALGRFWYQLEDPGVGARAVTGTYVLVAERQGRDWKIRVQLFKPEAAGS